jgi:hypothetical protein
MPPSSAEDIPNPETVDELLKLLYRLVDDERARGHGLDAKTSTLAGFSGAILALTATVGSTLFDRDLGDVAIGIRGLFIAAVIALAVAATLAVGGVLQPQSRMAISLDEVRRFREFPLIAGPKMDVQGQMLTTTIGALVAERRLNDRKARLTRYAARALVVGFIAVAAMAVTLGATESVEADAPPSPRSL